MSVQPPSGDVPGEALAPLAYIDAIEGAGGIPLCIPPYEDHGKIRRILPFLKGFLFIGGADYHPEHYGGHPQPEEELVHPRRDHFDVALAKFILEETDLPVLGICGGCQLLSIARGGALIQDIGTEWSAPAGVLTLPHSRQDRENQRPIAEAGKRRGRRQSEKAGGMAGKGPATVRVEGKEDFSFLHPVRFTPHSLVARATGTATGAMLATNSFHHQAIHPDRIGKYLIASAWSADGIIEAIEPASDSPWAASNRFVLGLQWHPERMQDEAPHRQPFWALVKAAANHGVSAF